ncbi:MAG: cysteine-rich CWC family protein [Pseudomonadales bacterium]|nr:cysteine-rich CWC family protein [Pseudomonadales bacterium]
MPTIESICPFCQKANRCEIAVSSNCWCQEVQIPASLLELLPMPLRDKACICAACVQSYHSNKSLFKSNLV